MFELIDTQGNRFVLSASAPQSSRLTANYGAAVPKASGQHASRLYIRHLLRDCKPLQITRACRYFSHLNTQRATPAAGLYELANTNSSGYENTLYAAIAAGQIRLQQTLKVRRSSKHEARQRLGLAKSQLRNQLRGLAEKHASSSQTTPALWGLQSQSNLPIGQQIRQNYQLFIANRFNAAPSAQSDTSQALSARQHAAVMALGFLPSKISAAHYQDALKQSHAIWQNKELCALLDDFIFHYSRQAATPATRFEIAQILLLCAEHKPDILKMPTGSQIEQFAQFKKAGEQLKEAAQASALAAQEKARTGSLVDLSPQSAGNAEVRENTAPPEQPTFVEITLLDDKGEPVANEPYWIRDPEGNEYTGNTDAAGMARVDQIKPGMCQIKFPERDSGGVGGAVEASTNPPPAEKPKSEAATQENSSADGSETPQTPEANTSSMIEEPDESESIFEDSKESADNYWETQKETADNFPEYLAAHLMGLNAETGYSIAEGLEATYNTVTDWDKFKGAVSEFSDGVADVVTDPKGTYDKLVKTTTDFYNLPDAEKGDAAYKAMMGALAGGGAAKGAGALGKVGLKGKSSGISKKTLDKKYEAKSLADAQAQLQKRRQQIQAEGYQPKYSDDELIPLAQYGDVGNDRFQARFMEAGHLANRNTPTKHLSGSMGLPMEGVSGKGAKYWSTSLDQIEDADTDPKLIANKLGIDYNEKKDYVLVIVDTEKAVPLTGVKSVPATFEEVGNFSNRELPNNFSKDFVERAMTPEFQASYAKHYDEAVRQRYIKNWSTDATGFEDYLRKQSLSKSQKEDFKLRMTMHEIIGNNHEYLGNGLTKDLNSQINNEFGAVETLNFERKEINLHQLHESGALNIITGIKPI